MPLNAPVPVFDSLESTKSAQRVSGLPVGGDLESQLFLSILDARNEFYLRIGVTATATLEALDEPPQPPTTDNHYRWLLGYATEQKLIRRSLLRQFTRLSKEGNASRLYQEWNDVGAFRELSASNAAAELDKLDAEIERAFSVLSSAVAPGEAGSIRCNSVGSQLYDQYRVLGYSLYAQPAYLFHFSLDTANE